MSENVIQPAFSAGEVAPSYWGRVDMAKYHVGLALAKNFFVDVRGGISTREGSLFIGRARISQDIVRLIPFEFSIQQTYALEFGQLYVRFISEGSYIYENAFAISNITQANPGVVTAPGHNYSNGDEVTLSGIGGMQQLNGRSFLVAGVAGNTFQLTNLNGFTVDTTIYTAYNGGLGAGAVQRVYTLTSPYQAADLPLLKFTQSADVMTLTHPSYATTDLIRSGATNWAFVPVVFAASIGPPVGISAVPSKTGDSTNYNYRVTTVSALDGEESIPFVGELIALNSKTMSQNVGAFVTVTWNAVPNALQYNIYRQQEVPGSNDVIGGLFGYVGTSVNTSFVDNNTAPNFAVLPPDAKNPFAGGNNPGCTTYFQQRKVYAGSNSLPQTFWMTQPGNFKNMNISLISKQNDAITATLAAQQVNAIQFLVQMSSLIALTTSGAWQITGTGQDSAITPGSVRAVALAYSGCSATVQPLTINYDILYVPYLGNGVYDLTYNYILQSFNGEDISVLSSHFFYNHTIVSWAWEEAPLKRIWAIREDGVMLCLTYFKSQDLAGWSQHVTQGYYQSIVTIPEGGTNATYAVVTRQTPGGGLVKYIERFTKRTLVGDVMLAHTVDAGLRYPYFSPPGNCFVTSAKSTIDPGYLQVGDVITVQTDMYAFGPDSGWAIRINGGKLIITNVISPTEVLATVVWPLTNIFPSATGTWSIIAPTSQVGGLDHLNGLMVTGLSDGSVIPLTQVVNGVINIPWKGTDIVVGLPYTCQLQTLPLDAGEPTIQGKRKRITAVTMRVVNTRGLEAGPDFENMTQVKENTRSTVMGQPVPLITGDQRVNLKSKWQEQGQICVQQSNPLPATITALIPEIELGDDSQPDRG